MNMDDLARKTIGHCQSFLDGDIDSQDFGSQLLTFAFTSVGVGDEDMKVFAVVLEALYKMKSMGRNDIINVFKNVKGPKKAMIEILEDQPIRQVPERENKDDIDIIEQTSELTGKVDYTTRKILQMRKDNPDIDLLLPIERKDDTE